MTGHGAAHGAVTILNATATGHGASLAVQGGVTATWDWTDAGLETDLDGRDDRLVRAVRDHLVQHADSPPGARVGTTSRWPPARGLKTSSSAAAALLRAGLDALGTDWEESVLIDAAVACSRSAGVTLTGALDDQTAVVAGGCHLTDNRSGQRLRSVPVPDLDVAVWVPAASIPKSEVADVPTSRVAPALRLAEEALLQGDLAGAMTTNGAAFHALYRDAGLPVTDAPVQVALDAGALGAGLSGTGPAVAALFARGDRPPLPQVAGGTWEWTEVVP